MQCLYHGGPPQMSELTPDLWKHLTDLRGPEPFPIDCEAGLHLITASGHHNNHAF